MSVEPVRPVLPQSDRPSRLLGRLLYPIEFVGCKVLDILEHVGAVLQLAMTALVCCFQATIHRDVRIGRSAVATQIVRVGVSSIAIVSLVSGAVGLILALQLAPPLDDFGQRPLVANIIGVAVLRELGPLIGAIVLTGFAGASIAAELGTMVVSEEIEALEAHALDPVRFLVVPRIIATTLSMTALGVISSAAAIAASLVISVTVLDIPFATYMENTLQQAKVVDFATGVLKSAIFGLLIGAIACENGLRVRGGAAGVGRATTYTVVESIIAIVIADLIFTAIFFALDLN